MITILLVEDDPLQAAVRKSVLERRFSDVRRVSDAAEALCLVEQPQFASHLGLVVSGNQRSGIGISDFVAELRARMPGIPVLVLGENGGRDAASYGPGVCFLSRPVSADEMITVATRMMAEAECKTT